jgi:hypothetical protein
MLVFQGINHSKFDQIFAIPYFPFPSNMYWGKVKGHVHKIKVLGTKIFILTLATTAKLGEHSMSNRTMGKWHNALSTTQFWTLVKC